MFGCCGFFSKDDEGVKRPLLKANSSYAMSTQPQPVAICDSKALRKQYLDQLENKTLTFASKKPLSEAVQGCFGRLSAVSMQAGNEEQCFALKEISQHKNAEKHFFNEYVALMHLKDKPDAKKFIPMLYMASASPCQLVMTFIFGCDLYDYLDESEKADEQKANIAFGAAKGLAFLHSHNIVHCDVKPENIMVDRNSSVKIIDFGAAKLQSSNLNQAAREKVTKDGTLAYMAPEVLLGVKCADQKPIDIASLGFTFLVMAYTAVEDISYRGVYDASRGAFIENKIARDKPDQLNKGISSGFISYKLLCSMVYYRQQEAKENIELMHSQRPTAGKVVELAEKCFKRRGYRLS